MSLSVLLAEDHPVVREGLRAMLEAEGDFQVVGQTGNSSEVGGMVEELHPDVDIDRTTASVIYQGEIAATTLAWGRSAPDHGAATGAWLLESAARLGPSHTVFFRAERTANSFSST